MKTANDDDKYMTSCDAPGANRNRRSVECGGPVERPAGASLAGIVRAYIARRRPAVREELDGFKAERSLDAAIERAGMARRRDGKRYSHQHRLKKTVLREATRHLRRAGLGRARDFADLHRRVAIAIGDLVGIGDLTIYDTAFRIGAKLGVFPKVVYLHCGTRKGARALGLKWRAASVAVQDCPRELRVLSAHEIEDCLCVFKDRLAVQHRMHPTAPVNRERRG
jgi:hypothetical protein